MKTRITSFLVVLCCTFALRAQAQNEVIVDSLITDEASGTISNAMMSFGSGYLWARGDFGERPGSDDSFATFGGFGGVYLFGPNEFAFADGRVWVTDNSRVGGEMGIGNRWIGDRVAFGINSFLTYDTGQMAQDSNHTRISVGGEILMDYFSLTANGYLPLNDDPRRFGPMMLVDKLTLLGNNAVFQNLQMAEQQMQGVDFELSAQIPRAEWLTVAGGGYHFEANDGGDAVNGVVGRVGVDLTSVLFDVSIQDDDRFGTTLNVGGEVRLGSGPPALIPRYRNLQTKIVERVRHRSRVALNQFLVTDNELAINPATGLPFTFINVDNTAAPGGDGSFENRFNDLGLANGPDGDIILVWRGDSSAINTTPNTGGLLLDDNQQIYGQGTNLFLQTLNRVAPSEICEFTDIGTNPFVDAPINLANNNLVQGLNIITAPGMNAIGGTNSSNFQILDINQDMGAGNTGPGGGIVLNNATGTGLISNFQYRTANPAAPGGIVINNVNAADLDLIIEDAPVIEGGAAGIALLPYNSDIEAMITNVQATRNVDGLVLGAANGGNVDATVASSSFNDAIANGAEIDVTTGGNVDLVAVDTDFMGAGVDAINANPDNGTGSITLSNSSLEGAMDDAFDLTLANGADFDQMFNMVTGNGVGDDGVVVNATGGSTYNGEIANSTFDGVGTGMFGDGNAFELDFDGSNGMLTLLNTSGAMADNDAIQLEGTNSSTIGLMLDNSTMFSGPGGDGLDILNEDSTVMVLADSTPDTPVDFSGAMGNGLLSASNGVANTSIVFMDGANFDNAGLDAINITSVLGATTTFAGTAVSGASAGDDAIYLWSIGGVINMTITEAGSFANAGQTDNTGNGIDVNNQFAGMITLNLDGAGDMKVDFTGAASSGLFTLSIDPNTVTTLNFNDGADFSFAGASDPVGDAIDAYSFAGAVTNINGQNMMGTNAADDGIDLFAAGMDSEINIAFTGSNIFTDATSNGILSNNTDGTVVVTIDDADFSGAVNGDGLDSTATGATATSTFNFNMGAMFDDAAMGNAIILSSQMGATTDFNGDGISGTNAGLDAINLTANGMGSDVQFDIVNSTDFFNSGQDGLDFTVDNMANMDINIAGAMGAPVNFDDLENGSLVQGGHGVLGNIDNMSTATLMLNFTSFNDAAIDGLDVMAAADSTFTGTISNSTFNNALVDGLSVDMDGSTGVLNLTNVDANNAGDNGLMLRADDTMAVGSSTLDVNLNTVNLNMAMGDAINAIAMDGGYIDIDGVDVNGQGAKDMGIQLSADASQIDLTLTTSNSLVLNNFTNSGDSGLVFNGMNGSTLNVNVSDTNFDDAGGFGINGSLTDSMATLNLTDVSANNAASAGLRIRADNSTVMGTLGNVSLEDAGTDAIFVQGLNAADVDLTMDFISGLSAGDDGFDIVATGNMTDINVQIDNSDFSDATNNGLEVDFSDFSNVVFNSDMNLSLNNAGQSAATAGMGDAINLFGDTNATADIDVTSGSLLNAFDDMTDAVMIMGGATGSVLIDPTPATGAGDNGLEFEVASGGTFNFFMGVPGGAVDPDSPISTIADPVGNNGVLGTIDNGTVNLTFTNSDINTDGTSAGSGINVTGTNASDFNLTLTNSDVMGWSNGNGIIVDMTDSDATLNLNGADLSGAGMDALSVSGTTGMSMLQTGSTVMVDLGTGANLDNADDNALNVNADGMMSTVSVMGTGVSGENAGGDAIALNSDNGATLNLMLTDVGSFANAGNISGGSGINANADNGSMLTVDIDNSATTPANFDGAELFGVSGTAGINSVLTMNLDNLTANGAGTGGLNLTADGMGANLMGTITDTSFQDSGMAGLNMGEDSFGVQINALNGGTIGSTGTPGITFNNVMTGNSDPTFTTLTQDQGVVINSDGNSLLNVDFTNLTAVGAESNGVQVNVNATMPPSMDDTSLAIVNIDMSTINDNFGNGVELNAFDGPSPVAPPQLPGYNAGILANISNTSIQYNGNNIPHPGTDGQGSMPGADGDMIGFGVVGNGDDNFVTVNFDTVDLSDNEEGAAWQNATSGGIVNFNYMGMTLNSPVIICADGDGSFASSILNDVTIMDITGDQAAISMRATGGGQAVGDFTDVTIMNVEAQAFAFLSQGDNGMGTQSNVTANFNGLDIINAATDNGTTDTKTGLATHAVLQGLVDGGTADINLVDVTIDNNNTMVLPTLVNALDMDATNGGELDLMINNFTVMQDGMMDSVTNAQAGEGEIDVTVDATSHAIIDFNTINVDFSDAGGINLTDNGTGGTFDIVQLDGIQANNAANGSGFNLEGTLMDSDGVVTLQNSSFDNASFRGVSVDLDLMADTTLNLTSVSGLNAGNDGVDITLTAGAGVMNSDVNLTDVQGQGNTSLDLNIVNLQSGGNADIVIADSTFDNSNTMDAMNITISGSATDSTATLDISNTTATGAASEGLMFTNSGMTDVTSLMIDTLDVSGAGGIGIDLNLGAQGADSVVSIANLTANDTGGLAIDLDVTNSSAANDISLTNVTANNSDDTMFQGGIDILLDGTGATGFGSTQQTITIDGVSAQNAVGVDGLNIVVSDLMGTDDIDISIDNTVSGVTNNFSNADGDGINIDITGPATTTGSVHVENVIANDVGVHGVDVNVAGGITVDMGSSFNNITATGAGGDGLQITDDATSTITAIRGMNNNFDGATGNGIFIDVTDQASAIAVEFTDTTANNAGMVGVDINLGTGGMIPGGNILLSNVDATNSMLGGLDIDTTVDGAGTFDVTINGGTTMGEVSDFSNADEADGVNINIVGGNTINLSVDGVTSSNNGLGMPGTLDNDGFVFTTDPMVLVNINDFANLTTNNNDGAGIELNFDNTTVNFDANMTGVFENITSTMNETNGLAFNFDNTTTQFQGVDAGMPGGTVIIDGLDLSNNGQAGSAFDGLDFSADNSDVAFQFNDLTIDGSGGRAIDLDVTNSSNVIFNVVNTGQTFDGSGLEGMDIDVDNSSLTSTFMGIDILNSGAFPTIEADGVNVLVSNMATVDLTFDDVTSDGSDQDGFDIDLTAGTTGTITVQNGTTGSGNGDGTNGIGFALTATDAVLTLNMDGSMNPNMFNMNDDEGVLIDLNGMTMVNNLSVDVTANQNTSDGVRIEVDPNVNFTPAGGTINANNVVANNNMGSGLVIDVDSNPTITAFDLTGAAFTGNAVDQVYLGFTGMALTSLNINDVDVTGTATSEDGIEINLVDTTVTNVNVFDLVAMNNGENGLNLFLDETMRTNMMTESSIGNLTIEQSMFTGNSALYNRGDADPANDNFAAILITQRGESTIDADLFDNTINANSGIGINVQVQDGDDSANMNPGFTIENTNTANSFYNNTITNNGGFGFLLTASEPLDLSTGTPDPVGPTYTLDLGVDGLNANTITGNTDAAVAIRGRNDSSGSFNIVNSLLTGTVDGDDPNFDGDGLGILLENHSSLMDLVATGSTVVLDGNAGSGLSTDLRNFAQITNYDINGVTIQGNDLHGVNVARSGEANYMNGIQIRNSTLQNNVQNGINIVHTNDPLAGPLFIDIHDNTLSMNQDGITMVGMADARFVSTHPTTMAVGGIVDNTFTMQDRHGINIQLQNDSQLGDSNQNQAMGEFKILGNEITNSGMDGILLDVNRTQGNVTPGFPGTAFANVRIGDSMAQDSTIAFSGRNGITILDDSSFGAPAAMITQNTYRIENITVSNSTQDGLHVEQQTINAPGIEAFQGGIDLQLSGDNMMMGNLDLIFENSGDDGIDITMLSAAPGEVGAGNVSNLIDIIGVQVLNSGTTPLGDGGHGIKFHFDDTIQAAQAPTISQAGGATITFRGRTIVDGQLNGGDDGINMTVHSDSDLPGVGQIVNTSMVGVESRNNGGRGMFVQVERNNDSGNDVSIFNIGNPNQPTTGGLLDSPSNVFSDNGLEGVIFDIQADAGSLSQGVVSGGTAGARTANNDDVFVDVNNTLNAHSGTYVSSQNQNAININNRPSGSGTDIHGIMNVQFYNNELEGNGRDGLVLSVGSLMKMNAAVAGNEFTGNGGFDINIFPVRSNGMNPPSSINNANPPADDHIVFDPVAYLDLVLGTIDSDMDGDFDANDMVAANRGQGMQFLESGTLATAPITAGGAYTNADPFKPTNRPVWLMGLMRVNDDNGNGVTRTMGPSGTIDWQESFFNVDTMLNQPLSTTFELFGNGGLFPSGAFTF